MPTITTPDLAALVARLASAISEERVAQSAVRALPVGERDDELEALGGCKYSTDDAFEALAAAVEAVTS